MNRRMRLISLIAAFLLLSGSRAIGAYYSSKSLSFSLSADLSGIPSPTPEPTPEPTANTGNGLVFSSNVSVKSIDWNSSYKGDLTSVSLRADNVNHVLDFSLTFTMPAGYSQEHLKNNKIWFSGIWLKLSGTNHYDGKISLDGSGSSGNGSGVAQLQSVKLDPGQSSSNITAYLYHNWEVPEYKQEGNIIVVKLKPSYTKIGISTDYAPWYRTEKYSINATITLVLPPQSPGLMITEDLIVPETVPSTSPSLLSSPTPEPTTAPETEQMASTTPDITAGPTASSSLATESTTTPVAEQTASPTPETTVAPTASPSLIPESTTTPETEQTASPTPDTTAVPTASPSPAPEPMKAPAAEQSAPPTPNVTAAPMAVPSPTTESLAAPATEQSISPEPAAAPAVQQAPPSLPEAGEAPVDPPFFEPAALSAPLALSEGLPAGDSAEESDQ